MINHNKLCKIELINTKFNKKQYNKLIMIMIIDITDFYIELDYYLFHLII